MASVKRWAAYPTAQDDGNKSLRFENLFADITAEIACASYSNDFLLHWDLGRTSEYVDMKWNNTHVEPDGGV